MSSALKKIASNTFSQVAAKLVTASLSVIIVKLISEKVGTAGYGEYALIYDFLAIFLIIADFGLFTIAVKEMSHDDSSLKRILGNVLSLRIILMTILSIAAITIAYQGNYPESIKQGIVIAAIGMSFNLISITVSAALQAKLKMTWNALATIIGKVVMLAYIIYTIKFISAENAIYHFILAGLYGNLSMLVVTAAATRSITKIRLYADFGIWKDLIKKTALYGLSLITVTLYLRISTLILGHYHDTQAVGIYQAPFRVFEIINLIPIILLNCVLPIMVQSLKDKEKLKRITQHTFDFLILACFGIATGLFTLAKPVILLLFSQDFQGSVGILQILSFGTIFNALYILFSYILLAQKKEKELLYANLATLLAIIPLAFILIKPLAETGAALTILASQAMIAIITIFITRPKLKLQTINKATIASVAMGLFILKTDLNLILTILAASTIYIAILVVSRAISPQILQILPFKKGIQRNKIAIDIRSMIGEKAGKGWYTYNVLEELGQLDQENTYFLYAKHDFYLPPNMPSNFQKRIISGPILLWHLLVTIDIKLKGINVLFAPASYIIPSILLGQRTKIIPVIHDLVSILYPKNHNKKAKIIEWLTIKRTLKHAKTIISVSDSTKNDIINKFNVSDQKIITIPEAARKNYYIESFDQRIINKYNLPKDYVLFIGTLEPRKNIQTLIKAVKETNTNLVIVGKKGWNYKQIFQTVTDCNLEDRIIFTGYVPDIDLPHILNAAQIFVYPSLYEGFGLPLLEAYAANTATISSNTKALLEIAKNTSPTFAPQDHKQLSEVINDLINNPEKRNQIIVRQKQKLQEYSWRNTSKKILEIINK